MINILNYKTENAMKEIVEIIARSKQEIVFFCVGNKKVWYDSFGALVADKLREFKVGVFVYGGEPLEIIPENLNDYIEFIESVHKNALVFIVDNVLTFDSNQPNVIFTERGSNVAGFLSDRTFGNYSILCETNPRMNAESSTEQQKTFAQNVAAAVLKGVSKNVVLSQILLQNNKIN